MRNKSKLIVKTAVFIGAAAASIYGIKHMTTGTDFEANKSNLDSEAELNKDPDPAENNNIKNSVTTKTAVGYSIRPNPAPTPTPTPTLDNTAQPTTEDKLNFNDISDTSIKIDVD